MSSPEPAYPEKSAGHFTPVLSSHRTRPQPQSPSTPFTNKNEAARVHHPFAPRGTASSDDEEYLNLAGHSNSTSKKSGHVRSSSSSRVAFSTPTRAHFPSQACASFQASEGSPRDSKSHSIHTLLGEVKSAMLRLHEDLGLVIQELALLNSYLGNLSGSSPPARETLQDPQASRGRSDPI